METSAIDAIPTSLSAADACIVGRFQAMGCACEILLDSKDWSIGGRQLDLAIKEACRIEKKYSRYIQGNIIDQMNTSDGSPMAVDEETAGLLDYASECYHMSDGLFDITTGVLRKIWRFDAGARVSEPSAADLERVRSCVGWDKIEWKKPFLRLPLGFEIDLGGICKEYAADRVLELLIHRQPISTCVNLGGDIATAGEKLWSIGIEDPPRPGKIIHTIQIRKGGLATSGTTKRFVTLDGTILGHILNPQTGWPVRNAPTSVTVAGRTCTEAGFWSTMAVLQGDHAEDFLKEQSLEFWCYRPA